MRAILGLFSALLKVAGFACGLGGLAILTLGPPAQWLEVLPTGGASFEVQDGSVQVSESDLQPADNRTGLRPAPRVADKRPTMSPPEVAPPTPEATPAAGGPTPETTRAASPTPFRPITRIIMPSIPLIADVTPARLVKRGAGMTWNIPAFQAGHADTTAGAGAPGNAVLLGHLESRGAGHVFANLAKARIGDLVRIFSGEQYFDYRVAAVRNVSRTDVSVFDPTEASSLSLITCSGPWIPFLGEFADRLVVRADLDKSVPNAASPHSANESTDSAARAVFDESFVDNRRGWPQGPGSTIRIVDGTYRLTASSPGKFVAVGAPTATVFDDVEVDGVFRKIGGPPGGGYGLIARHQDTPADGVQQGGRYYVLEIDDRGRFGVWRRDEDHWIDLLPWTPSEAVQRGTAVNHLAVRASGAQLAFTVNGLEVATVTDATLPSGRAGIFVGGDFNDVAVERFVIRQ
jgi:LPXTG-site transpeptidase (sortase) family protein